MKACAISSRVPHAPAYAPPCPLSFPRNLPSHMSVCAVGTSPLPPPWLLLGPSADSHMLRWTFRTFTNFPVNYWPSTNSHSPCGVEDTLSYQGVTCSHFAGNTLYVTRM